jgi:hypothetical protein
VKFVVRVKREENRASVCALRKGPNSYGLKMDRRIGLGEDSVF